MNRIFTYPLAVLLLLGSLSVLAQSSAKDAGATLLTECHKLVKKNDCKSLAAAIDLLTAYEILAENYSLASKKAELDLLKSHYSKCPSPGSYRSWGPISGSFVNKRIPTPGGGFTNYEVIPGFIYSTYFMTNEARQAYVNSLDSDAFAFYTKWTSENPNIALHLKSETDKLKVEFDRKKLEHALQGVNWKDYEVPENQVKELKADILKDMNQETQNNQ